MFNLKKLYSFRIHLYIKLQGLVKSMLTKEFLVIEYDNKAGNVEIKVPVMYSFPFTFHCFHQLQATSIISVYPMKVKLF